MVSRRPSITERLKALGVKIGTSEIKRPVLERRKTIPIEEVVDGRYVNTRGGDIFVFERTYPEDYHHGIAGIQQVAKSEIIAAWAQDSRLATLTPATLAFLDTETSGLSGGTGTLAFMVGVGRFEGQDFRLAQFFMRDPTEESALLEGLADFLAPCQALVTFNGKAFDAPLLRTRYILHSIPNPLGSLTHLDLLPLARRLWRDRLSSRALSYLEEHVLSAPRTEEDIPGYEIPYLYFDYLRTGDARPLKGVFYHNAMDVLALAALLSHMGNILSDPFDGKVQHGIDFVALAKLFESLGEFQLGARLYERGLEVGLGEEDFWNAIQRLSILQKRRGDITEAVRLWEQAAAEGHIYAHIELSKYHEHRQRDPIEALRWVRSAMELVEIPGFPDYSRRYWLKDIEHRLARLEKKAQSGGG